jgi:hypothetical protein
MKNWIIFILSLLAFKHSFGQESKKQDIITATLRYHYGVVLPHHKSISYLVNDQVSAIELNIGLLPDKNRKWAQLYNQPEIGLGFYHGSLGNKEILGSTNAIFPYINFKLKEFSSFKFELQTGIGVAHTKKHFDPVNNYTNIAIGSKFNAFFKLLINSKYYINPQWSINGGVGFQHISNGSVNTPNKGLNIATGNIGVQYNFKPYKRFTSKLKSEKKLDNELNIVWSNGVKQASEIDQHKYYISSLSSNYAIGINAKQRVGFGIDLFYNEAANRGDWNFKPETGFKDRFSQAIIITHDLVIQKFSIITHLGVYTLYKTNPEKPIYTRVGLRYKLNNKIITNLSLKAHLGKADFIEWGIGYRICKKKK